MHWLHLFISLSVLGISDCFIANRLPAISLHSLGKGAAIASEVARYSNLQMSASLPAVAKKPYDLILWGATGFTGSLCARYLSVNYGEKLKIAIAGRNEDKLKALNVSNVGMILGNILFLLSILYPHCYTSIDILTADLNDPSSLDKMTGQTTVLISTAGPFAKIGTTLEDIIYFLFYVWRENCILYRAQPTLFACLFFKWTVGMPIVDACVRTSTNYVDITGEPQYVRKVIDSHHAEATSKGIKLVPCCGFDCIPSDLGCQMMVEEMKNRNLQPKEVRLLVDKALGGASGGTIASVLNIIESSSLTQLTGISFSPSFFEKEIINLRCIFFSLKLLVIHFVLLHEMLQLDYQCKLQIQKWLWLPAIVVRKAMMKFSKHTHPHTSCKVLIHEL